MAVCYIYCLLEPNDNIIRYVGKTQNRNGLDGRLKKHVSDAKLRVESNSHLFLWVRKILACGEIPRIQAIAIVDALLINDAEIAWIAYFKHIGCDLVNTTAGGTGGATRLGMKTPDNVKARQALARAQLKFNFAVEKIVTQKNNEQVPKTSNKSFSKEYQQLYFIFRSGIKSKQSFMYIPTETRRERAKLAWETRRLNGTAYVKQLNQNKIPLVCGGCTRTFVGPRGLRRHQTSTGCTST